MFVPIGLNIYWNRVERSIYLYTHAEGFKGSGERPLFILYFSYDIQGKETLPRRYTKLHEVRNDVSDWPVWFSS